MQGKVITSSLRIRKTKSTATTANVTGYLYLGDVVTGTIEEGWWNITAVVRASGTTPLPPPPCYASKDFITEITTPPVGGVSIEQTQTLFVDKVPYDSGTITFTKRL